jgi:DASS family divalent anion:Na+ symporter
VTQPRTTAVREPQPEATIHDGAPPPWRSSAARLIAVAAIYVLIAHVAPRPAAITPQGWRITAVFLATVSGLMLQPLPGAAIVIVGLTMLVIAGGMPVAGALTGFAAPSVWLVLAAMLMSRVLRDTGLSRRIALLFVRAFGRTSIGVSYALLFSDVTLAAGIPSITARSGSIILPIARGIADLYESHPGPTAARLGRFLMASLYQGSVVACAMFMTGQASNVLAVDLAAKTAGVSITWSSWFAAGIVPGLASCAVVPYLVYRMLPPVLRRTPAASDYARDELRRMGPVRGRELTVLAVFSLVCVLWITSAWHHLDVTIVAMAGVSALFVTGVLTWDTALSERSAWDVFVWYGGLMTMGEALNATSSTTVFAEWVGGVFGGAHWTIVLLATVLIYFYAHYAFASITTHLLAMFPPFVIVLTGAGTPPLLAVYTLACLANLTAGLTHYGTTTAPIVYSQHYVSVRDWWTVGLAASVANLAVWLTIGFAWWKVLGFW